MRVLVAVDDALAAGLARCGVDVLGVCDPDELAGIVDGAGAGADRAAVHSALDTCDAVVVPAAHPVLDSALARRCDAVGARIVAVVADAYDDARAAGLGVGTAQAGDVWSIVDALAEGFTPTGRHDDDEDASVPPTRGRIIAVWGPSGAPGRSTVAALLAAELVRGGRRVGLVDADSHAPAIALMLGLADEAPGFAAACRGVATGALDAAELARIAQPLHTADGIVGVLCGINRPGRWPELAADRVSAALETCRDWAEYTVVDVAASLERDEEIVSDLDGPRRNAATHAALASADVVVAVGTADPLGAARLMRGLTELRACVGAVPVRVVVNRMRPGPLGIDARGQLRRGLERFAGVEDVWFLPEDRRAVDAALLHARPVGDAAPRSPLVAGVRRFAGEAVVPALIGDGPWVSAAARTARRSAHDDAQAGSRRSRWWRRRGAGGAAADRRAGADGDADVDADGGASAVHTVLPTVLRPHYDAGRSPDRPHGQRRSA